MGGWHIFLIVLGGGEAAPDDGAAASFPILHGSDRFFRGLSGPDTAPHGLAGPDNRFLEINAT